MTKPVLLRPRTFELIAGLALVVLAACIVVVRNGPQQSWAGDPIQRERATPKLAGPAAQDGRDRTGKEVRPEAERVEAAIAAASDSR